MRERVVILDSVCWGLLRFSWSYAKKLGSFTCILPIINFRLCWRDCVFAFSDSSADILAYSCVYSDYKQFTASDFNFKYLDIIFCSWKYSKNVKNNQALAEHNFSKILFFQKVGILLGKIVKTEKRRFIFCCVDRISEEKQKAAGRSLAVSYWPFCLAVKVPREEKQRIL